MTVPRWLDRIWLCIIAISFVLVCGMWLIVWSQQLGWLNVSLYLAALFFGGFYRGLPSGHRRG